METNNTPTPAELTQLLNTLPFAAPTMNTHTDTIDDLTSSIRLAQSEMDKLLGKLEDSRTLESLVPGIFDAGPARVRWTSTPIPASGGKRQLTGVAITGEGVEIPLPLDAAKLLGVSENTLTRTT